MKTLFTYLLLFVAIASFGQKGSMRQILLDELKSTHNAKNWFVPVKAALEGLTATQAAWKDNANHSAGQLAYHLLFWNERQLKNFKGEKNADFGGNNEETFDNFNEKQWDETRTRLDQVLTDIEKWVASAPEAELSKHYGTLTNISTHNAYHTGQIIAVRKAQGSWNPENGVK